MARDQEVALIVMPGWRGGLNRDADPYLVALDETPDCLNVDFGLFGSVAKRAGYAAWDTAPGDQARKMLAWSEIGGSEHIIYVQQNGAIYAGTGSPTTLVTAGTLGSGANLDEYPVGMASLENVLYVTTQDATNPLKFDPSTWSQITATIFDGTSSRFPRAAYLATHHDRIFAANVNNAGVRYPSRMHWSDALDAETWTAANYWDFDPDDGQQITGLAPFGESLVVFKNHSMHMLVGKSEESFQRYKVETQVGTEAPNSIVSIGGFLFFWDPSTGVWAFDGASFDQKDEKIQEYLRDGVNWSKRHVAHAWEWENRYYLSVPWGTDAYPSRTFVLDLRTEAWTEYDYGVPATAVFGGTLYGGSAGNASTIFTLESGLDDNGTAITSYFKTAWIAPQESPSAKFRLRRLDTVWTAKSNVNVDVTMYRDFSQGYTFDQDIDTDSGGAVWGTAVWGTDKWGAGVDEVMSRTTGWGAVRWRATQFKVGTTGLTDDWQLNRMGLVVSGLSRIRGEG